MDASENMDTLDDSTALPELSFDDLLEPSPIKKRASNIDDDALEHDNEQKSRPDDILNTPGPKKPPVMQKRINTTTNVATSSSKTLTTVRAQAVKLGNTTSTLTNIIKNNTSGGNTSAVSGVATGPVLLNSKNVLPKTSTSITNNAIKLTPKLVAGTTSATNVSLAGKTAVRTSNGQIIYIQKTTATSNIKTPATTNMVKSSALGGNNSKPVTIQVVRTADGNYVPIKTKTTGTNGKNATLTLSPTSLAGKKIITSAGGQVIIKGTIKSTDITGTTSTAKTLTTHAIAGVKTVVKPLTSTAGTAQISDLNKSKPIVVHGAGGKQIIVSTQNIVKLSPKSQTITTMAGGAANNTSTSGSGQMQGVQITNKGGVQYVRVLGNSKVQAKTLNTPTTTTATTTSSTVATKTVNTPNQPAKILNSLPQKFTVVQKGGTTKLLLTQKKDPSTSGNNTPLMSKVQRTIVTVPTIKSLSEDKSKNSATQKQQSLIKPAQPSLASSNSSNNQSLIRKHKISEINTEIQRMTTASDNTGPPEIKKPTPNNRIVLLSSNNTQTKILNSLQQPGRITSTLPNPNPTNATKTAVASGGGSTVLATQVTQNGNKLYTILKPPLVEQNKLYTILKPSHVEPKLYSVLKTNCPTNKVEGESKSLISTKQMLHFHQKMLQNKEYQQQQPASSMQNIKIKEEPTESNSTTASNMDTLGGQLYLPASTLVEDENDNLDPMVGGVRRKHCNCSKSQCLKLYCDCFANGEFCQDCSCKDCFNNLENEDERQRAIKICLERNPNAFKPKITSSRDQADMRLHNKGCNCKRSGCLKNYCECYEAKIPCSSNCKCVGCRNVEDRPDLDMDPIDPKIMATIAMGGGTSDNLAVKRNYEKSQRDIGASLAGISVKSEKLSKEPIKSFSGYEAVGATAASPTLERQQCNFITQEVIDATIQCMITQADECEKNNLPAYQTEKMVMEELGRCLVEIIDFSIRNTDNSYTQD